MTPRAIAGAAISWFVFSLVAIYAGVFLGVGYFVLAIAIGHLLVSTPWTSRVIQAVILGENVAKKKGAPVATSAWPSPYWILTNVAWFGLALLAFAAANVRIIDLLSKAFGI